MAIRSVRYPDGTKKERELSLSDATRQVLDYLVSDETFEAENVPDGYRITFFHGDGEMSTYFFESN